MLMALTVLLPLSGAALQAHAQTPATTAATPTPTPATGPAPASSRQIGTVKAISGTILTMTTDGGASVELTLSDTVRVQQLAPSSTDLKTAQPAAVADITTGDRVLAVTRTGDNGGLVATRVMLMKSGAIAQSNAARQADWQRRGAGGIVNAVDPVAKTLAVTSGAKKITVQTGEKTIFRRYAPGSVKFEEATPSTLSALQAGDQLRVRGDKSPDGSSLSADEIVSGSFLNLAGTITSVDPAARTLVLKDLGSKKNITVAVSDESDLRALPPEVAARFAARARGGAAGSGSAGSGATGSGATGESGASGAAGANASGKAASAAGGSGGTAEVPARRDSRSSSDASSSAASSTEPTQPPMQAGTGGQRDGSRAGRSGTGAGGGSGTSGGGSAGSGTAAADHGNTAAGSNAGGGDLSRVIERLPKASLADLKPGEALMIVASGHSGASSVTAVTLLTGVEPLLTASPRGAAGFSASNWNLGGGAGEGGGGEGAGGPAIGRLDFPVSSIRTGRRCRKLSD